MGYFLAGTKKCKCDIVLVIKYLKTPVFGLTLARYQEKAPETLDDHYSGGGGLTGRCMPGGQRLPSPGNEGVTGTKDRQPGG